MDASRYAEDDEKPQAVSHSKSASLSSTKPLPEPPNSAGLDASRFAGSPGPEIAAMENGNLVEEELDLKGVVAAAAALSATNGKTPANSTAPLRHTLQTSFTNGRWADDSPTATVSPASLQVPPARTSSLPVPQTAPTPDSLQRIASPALSTKSVRKLQSKKGRQCIIRVPTGAVYQRSDGWMPLSPEQIRARLEAFEKQGYSTTGWSTNSPATTNNGHAETHVHSQNRDEFPSMQDLQFERSQLKQKRIGNKSSSAYTVAIPDEKKWKSIEDDLIEAKLRALGVISAPDEPPAPPPQQPPSRNIASPFGPASAKSPPIPTSSAASHNAWQGTLPFSAPFSPASITNNTSMSGFVSPAQSMGPFGRPGHLSRQSTFGFQFPMAQPGQTIIPGFVPPQGYGNATASSRTGSPALASTIQRLPSAFSFSSVSGDNVNERLQTPKPELPQRSYSAHQQQDDEFDDNRPRTPQWRRRPDDPSQNTDDYGDLAYPTPRGHRHNISENLENQVERGEHPDEEYYPGEFVNQKYAQDQPFVFDFSKPFVPKAVTEVESSKHQSSASMASNVSTGSKFNVAAKEFKFNPASAHGRNYSMSKNALLPSISAAPAVSLITAHSNGTSTGGSNFDARAPVFRPPEQKGTFPFSSGFDFSAKREATPQKETEPEVKVEEETPTKPEEDKSEEKSKIFGGLNFADFVKPAKVSKAIPIVNPNRKSKAIPIVNPNDVLKSKEPEEEEEEDNEGRLASNKSRIKRGRLGVNDGDSVPQFATPTPEPMPAPSAEPAPAELKRAPTPVVPSQKLSAPEDSLLDMSDDPWHEFDDEPRPKTKSPVEPAKEVNAPAPVPVVEEPVDTVKKENVPPVSVPEPDQVTKAEPVVEGIVEPVTEKAEVKVPSRQPTPVIQSNNEKESAKDVVDSEPLIAISQDDKKQQEVVPVVLSTNVEKADADSTKVEPAVTLAQEKKEQPDVSVPQIETTEPTITVQQPIATAEVAPPPTKPTQEEAPKPVVQESSVPEPPAAVVADNSLTKEITAQILEPSTPKPQTPVVTLPVQHQQPAPQPISKAPSPAPPSIQDSLSRARSPIRASDKVDLRMPLVPIGSLEAATAQAHQTNGVSSEWLREQRSLRASQSPVRKLNVIDNPAISDWDDMLESGEELPELKFHDQSNYIDGRVRTLIEDIIREQLGPLQKSLRDVDLSVRKVATRAESEHRMFSTHDKSSSDADDEDDDNESGEITRPKSRKADKRRTDIKLAVTDAIKAWEAENMSVQLEKALHAERDSKAQADALQQRADSLHAHAENLQKRLEISEQQIDLYKESAEDLEAKVHGLEEERSLKSTLFTELTEQNNLLAEEGDDLKAKIEAQENTLQQFRDTAQRWQLENNTAGKLREEMSRSIQALRREAEDRERQSEDLVKQIDGLNANLASTTTTLVNERQSSQKKEEEQTREIMVLSVRFEDELQRRNKLEKDLQRSSVFERDAIRANVMLEETQKANGRLGQELEKLRNELRREQDRAAHFEREATDVADHHKAQIKRTETLMVADVEIAKKRAENIRADLETRLEMLRKDHENLKSSTNAERERYLQSIEDAHASRREAIKHSADTHHTSLVEERKRFEKAIADLSGDHERALRLSWDDRQRKEERHGEEMRIAHEKNSVLQDRIALLEDKVAVAQSAAKAAASAAQSSTNAKGTMASSALPDVRDRVSPQALRESIVVLQEQLQEREGRIESLQAELDKVDKELPRKLTERETEVGWLRELLSVRVDDLGELVNTLAADNFDRANARDAAIRIRANLQMEQQMKERLINRGPVNPNQLTGPQLPSLADIQNFASPRAAQLAAAWGNWRRGGSNPVSSFRDSLSQQRNISSSSSSTAVEATPSRRPGSQAGQITAQNFMSGLMTPPASNVRRSPNGQSSTQPEHPVAEQRDQLPKEASSRQDIRSPTPEPRQLADPTTPPLLRKASYDEDAAATGAYDDDLSDEEPDVETIRETGLAPLGDELAAAGEEAAEWSRPDHH